MLKNLPISIEKVLLGWLSNHEKERSLLEIHHARLFQIRHRYLGWFYGWVSLFLLSASAPSYWHYLTLVLQLPWSCSRHSHLSSLGWPFFSGLFLQRRLSTKALHCEYGARIWSCRSWWMVSSDRQLRHVVKWVQWQLVGFPPIALQVHPLFTAIHGDRTTRNSSRSQQANPGTLWNWYEWTYLWIRKCSQITSCSHFGHTLSN